MPRKISWPLGGTEAASVGRTTQPTRQSRPGSPLLMQACATGTHLKEATITHRKAGKDQQDYLIVKMNDIIITGVTDGDASGQGGSETSGAAIPPDRRPARRIRIRPISDRNEVFWIPSSHTPLS